MVVCGMVVCGIVWACTQKRPCPYPDGDELFREGQGHAS